MHTTQPLAEERCACPAPRRAGGPRRARNRRAAPQSHPGTRRTFHEPQKQPGVVAERACQDRAIRPHQWHATPWRPAKPSQSAMSRAPAEPSLTRPGASVPRASATARAPPEPVRLAPPRATHCHAEPRRAAPSRAEPQAHPGRRRTFHEPRGTAGTDAERAWQDRAIQKPKHRYAPPRKGFPGRISPVTGVPDPYPPAENVLGPNVAARAPPETVHTRQPLTGGLHPSAHAAHRHAEPRRAAPRRRHTQARAAPFTSGADHQGPKRSAREV